MSIDYRKQFIQRHPEKITIKNLQVQTVIIDLASPHNLSLCIWTHYQSRVFDRMLLLLK
jgi:hypothetical protein